MGCLLLACVLSLVLALITTNILYFSYCEEFPDGIYSAICPPIFAGENSLLKNSLKQKRGRSYATSNKHTKRPLELSTDPMMPEIIELLVKQIEDYGVNLLNQWIW